MYKEHGVKVATGDRRVVRGGSWINNARNCRSAQRNHREPGNRNDNLGFRLARARDGAGRRVRTRPPSRPWAASAACGKKQMAAGMLVGAVDTAPNACRLAAPRSQAARLLDCVRPKPRRGATYQPRATPWVGVDRKSALKGRDIPGSRQTSMPQSLAKILLHTVFSTKNREPWIPESLQPRLHAYLAGACRAVASEALRVGGTENHVHIACTLPRTLTVSQLLEAIKKSSSQWVKKQDEANRRFAWQAGYGAFSLGQSQLPALVHYIDNQQEHHRARSFDDELRDLLQKYGIAYDERYLWD